MLESLAYDLYDDSFKTDCIFLVQSFTFFQKLMVLGSQHEHMRYSTKSFIQRGSGIPKVRALTYLYTIF